MSVDQICVSNELTPDTGVKQTKTKKLFNRESKCDFQAEEYCCLPPAAELCASQKCSSQQDFWNWIAPQSDGWVPAKLNHSVAQKNTNKKTNLVQTWEEAERRTTALMDWYSLIKSFMHLRREEDFLAICKWQLKLDKPSPDTIVGETSSAGEKSPKKSLIMQSLSEVLSLLCEESWLLNARRGRWVELWAHPALYNYRMSTLFMLSALTFSQC